MNLAPITLFVYNRPWHTQQTIEAFQKNELGTQSELIIYSDAPKTPDTKINVDKVVPTSKRLKDSKKSTLLNEKKTGA